MIDYAYWRFRPQFAEVLDPRLYPLEWLDAQVWSGAFKVWAHGDSCALTAIKPFPTGAFEVHVMIAAGDVETLAGPVIQAIEDWAQGIGALFVTVESRAAWAKVLKPRGYQVHQVQVRKEV